MAIKEADSVLMRRLRREFGLHAGMGESSKYFVCYFFISLSHLTRNDVPVPVLKRAVREILPLTCLFYIIFNSIVVIR